jgi:hypothetical protein
MTETFRPLMTAFFTRSSLTSLDLGGKAVAVLRDRHDVLVAVRLLAQRLTQAENVLRERRLLDERC